MELVECIKDDGYNPEHMKWIQNFPVKGETYTIRRRVHSAWGQGYLLEEIHNPLMPNGAEPNFHRSRFRKIDQPDGVEQLIKETNKEVVPCEPHTM